MLLCYVIDSGLSTSLLLLATLIIMFYITFTIVSRIWSIERRHIQDLEQPLTQIPRSCHYLTLNISEAVQYRHSYNGILIGTYTCLYSRVSFWMTLSELAKYSMTQDIARALCNNWASCCHSLLNNKSLESQIHCNLCYKSGSSLIISQIRPR